MQLSINWVARVENVIRRGYFEGTVEFQIGRGRAYQTNFFVETRTKSGKFRMENEVEVVGLALEGDWKKELERQLESRPDIQALI